MLRLLNLCFHLARVLALICILDSVSVRQGVSDFYNFWQALFPSLFHASKSVVSDAADGNSVNSADFRFRLRRPRYPDSPSMFHTLAQYRRAPAVGTASVTGYSGITWCLTVTGYSGVTCLLAVHNPNSGRLKINRHTRL